MANELTENQRQRLYALWDQAQTDLKYKDMLKEMRELEK